MKKLLLLILAACLVFSLAACSTNGQSAPAGSEPAESAQTPDADAAAGTAPLLGGWQKPASPVVTDEVQELFTKGTEGLLGVDYTPVAYLGSQLVSGTNHALLCRAASVTPNAAETYAIVFLYQDLQGKVEVKDIIRSSVETNLSGMAGSWAQAEDPTISDDLKAAFDEAMKTRLGVNYTPVALLSTQLVSGTNYCILSEATVVAPDAETEYAFVYLYEDLEGNVEITDIVNFDNADETAE